MSGWWEENLQEGKLGDLPIPITRRRKRGGRDGARHRFAFRDGQAVEDTGRMPRVYDLEIPLFRDVSESHYPIRKDNILRVIEDAQTKGSLEYTDPEDGAIRVKAFEYEWVTDATQRDGGILNLVLEEDNIRLGEDGSLTDEDALSKSLELAIAFDSYLMDLPEAVLQEMREETGFLDSMSDFVNSVYDGVDQVALAADSYAAYIDAATNTLNRLINYPPFGDVQNWSIVNACVDLVGSMTTAIERKQARDKPSYTTFTTPSEMSVYEVAVALYGDEVRGPEISLSNNLVNPMAIPAGTALRVLPP